MLADQCQDFGHCLVVMFLLCVFDLVYSGDGVLAFQEPSAVLLDRFGSWSQQIESHSDLSMRLIAWLKILQTLTSRGGGMGLFSETLFSLFPAYGGPLPSLKAPQGHQPDLSTHLYQVFCAPVFDFYFRVQVLSGEIAQLTHYHRSRTTGADQAEVVELVTHIKSRLHNLWESRPATQRQTSEELREQLAPKLADSFISLVGICNAAYHTEFVEMDRVLGDPVSKWTDSRASIDEIRRIVDNECALADAAEPKGLNPGYLRPLFLVAIECMDREQNRWAVDRIAQIRDPIYRAKFFSEFARELSAAQMRKERRVTSKYFSIWHFGVPPPYM
ncbi:hypothetical protein N0V84_001847 [Fusarium piperis]|uniref:Uncharacterized protein n=1 Tax=Fusarium piperis TaxID=1435070 RepID=A0A9W9BSX3_9HYPO|nr:hypothetical protein N0V84_001847 [Fusarium piperis]